MDTFFENVVVTGGCGAIGSRLVGRLLAEGAQSVAVVDDLSSGYAWLLPEDSRVRLLRMDVAELLRYGLHIRQAVVFHLAAFFANQNSIDHPLDDLHSNGLGTLATLLWARSTRAKKLVYASAGCSIAGHGASESIREDMPVSLHLDTPYQITKALGEFYCNYFNPEVKTVRARFFNSYGPGELPGTYRNVIPNFIWRALHHEPLLITGSGQETRDFIYVDDLVEGLVRAARNPAADGEAFNLGTGLQTRVLDLARMVIELSESRSRIEFGPRRPWDKSLHREADITRARQVLGFQPAVRLRAGLERTVAWFRENLSRIESELKREGATTVATG